MSKKIVIYVNEKNLEVAMKRRCRLLKYCKWALRWRIFITWGPGEDTDCFKWVIRTVKRRKEPVDLIFWTMQDIPSGITPEKLKAYTKGGDVHFVKEKLIF